MRHLDINPLYLEAIRQGLRTAASQPGGSSDDVMSSFPEPVYGMTGTAQDPGEPDSAWYAGFVPVTATAKPIVVVVNVERGGFGDVAAAPVARQILSQWFFGRPARSGPELRSACDRERHVHHHFCSRARSVPPVWSSPSSAAISSAERTKSKICAFSSIRSR